MNTFFLRIVVPVFAFAALALTARAQASDQLTVDIPHEFVAGGKTLPAGTYRVGRLSDPSDSTLLLSSFENRAGVLVHPSMWEGARADKTSLTFEQIDGRYFLTSIVTAEHVYTIDVPKSAVLLASRKSNQNAARSSASGAN